MYDLYYHYKNKYNNNNKQGFGFYLIDKGIDASAFLRKNESVLFTVHNYNNNEEKCYFEEGPSNDLKLGFFFLAILDDYLSELENSDSMVVGKVEVYQ